MADYFSTLQLTNINKYDTNWKKLDKNTACNDKKRSVKKLLTFIISFQNHQDGHHPS